MMRGLWQQRAVAEREYLDSLRGMKVAEAREKAAADAIEVARKRRELLTVRRSDLEINAPFDGRVVARHAELGEWLSEGAAVVTLISTGEIEAWLQLPERHAALMRRTSPAAVELRVPGNPEPIHTDKLSVIPDVDGRSRRFVLVAHIPDPENQLTPGSSVEATVPLGQPRSRVVIDSDAILQAYNGTYVWVPSAAEDGPPVSKRVPVTVLFERDGESVLADGPLAAGDRVIVEGNERLFPATPLDPRPWEETRGDNARATATSSR
jgi:RND family efflux transporter MFP subunit